MSRERQSHPSPSPRLKRIVAALLLSAGIALAGAQSASALRIAPETGTTGMLSLWSLDSTIDVGYMSPGDTFHRQFTIDLATAASAGLTMQLTSVGDLVEHQEGVTLAAALCDTAWLDLPSASAPGSQPRCTSHEIRVMQADAGLAVADGKRFWRIGAIHDDGPRFMLLTASLPAGDRAATSDMGADFAIQVVAEGDSIAPTRDPALERLADTGLNLFAIALIGIGGIGLGSVTTAVSRDRRRGDIHDGS